MEVEELSLSVNEYQTPLTKEFLAQYPDEVVEQFFEYVHTVPYIKNLISPARKKAKDLPRDEKGRIIVDLTHPHILEDMDYFRPAALHYEKHSCYTFLRPNKNPNSEYYKWINEEKRRCWEGYVRESDGEWVTGNMYWYMNYCPIMLTKIEEGRKKAFRTEGFPETWEGIYLRFHYIEQARNAGSHGIELARRGCSKSFCIASMLSKNLELGENYESRKRNTSILTAYQKEYLSDKDGTLSKFVPMIDFVSEHTEFPRLRLRSSSQDMFWQMGYVDEYGRKQGSLNTVMGVSSKDDESKLRGKRGHIFFEEMGAFPNLLSIYDVVRQGMEEGEYTYGFAYLVGTSDEDESNFESAKTLLYHPEGYNIYPIENVYDKTKLGGKNFGYFFPAYVNRKGCYNKDGVSDVVLSLFQILMARYKAKYSARPDTLLRLIAEMPITPAEAIIKSRNSFFPVTMLSERMNQLEVDTRAFDDVLTGLMSMDKAGNVKLVSCEEQPIRKWKTDNTTKGAVEIFELPQKDSNGKVYSGRYIMGHDPVDNDQAESSSFSSTFVLDLFTDRIVAEYTGRQEFADGNFEQVRLLAIYYNAIVLYESNKKGCFAYFQKMGCLHLLAPTPQFLRDKQLVKYSAFGSNAYGVNASAAINNFANGLIRDWMLKPVTMIVKDENGNDVEKTMPQLYLIRNLALLDEAKNFNPFENYDRIRALGMVMLLREEKLIMCGGDMSQTVLNKSKSSLAHDDFFERNYNR